MEMPRNLRRDMAVDDIDDIDDETAAAQGEQDTHSLGIEGDERRMQVRVYNHWAGLLGNAKFPDIADLQPEELEDFGPFSVLLDISDDLDNPAIGYLGATLAEECDVACDIAMLSDVPARSLLSRITDHYMQILANEAPIGFEAEFVNQRDQTVLYRGILLPYSSSGEAIDFIYGVINWKIAERSEDNDGVGTENPIPPIASPDDESDPSPRPRKKPIIQVDYDDLSPTDQLAYDAGSLPDGEAPEPEIAHPVSALGVPAAATPATEAENLADYLAEARELAVEAQSSEDRSRKALYEALGRAHDFALAAKDNPDDFTEILQDAGLKAQKRAPMTPVIKLVFGADYDKKRITEYSAALAHADRLELDRGAFAAYIAGANGGLKAIIAAERAARRKDRGIEPKKPTSGIDSRLAAKLYAIAPRTLDTLAETDNEFALVMVRRTREGKVVVLDTIPEDRKLLNNAAKKLLDARQD